MIESYSTLTAEVRHEIARIKGSRFIATAAPVSGTSDAEALVARVRKEFHDARHTASAWRIGRDGATWRFNDDGEPSGSAGRPILREIEGRDLVEVAVTVTRYFGGVKLGVGGLARAYGGAAAAALEAATVRVVKVTRRVTVTYPYELTSAMQALTASLRVSAVSTRFEADVEDVFEVAPSEVAAFTTAVTNGTAGRALVQVESPDEE